MAGAYHSELGGNDMIRAKRFFAKKLKRILISANRAIYSDPLKLAPGECEFCGGSGLANKGLMDICNFCHGTGVITLRSKQQRPRPIIRNPVDNLIEDFEDLAAKINRRYSRVALHYRDW